MDLTRVKGMGVLLAEFGTMRYNIYLKRCFFMWNRKPSASTNMALGGVLAALSVIFMGLGGLIPIATYVCPVIVMLILQLVLKLCGKRTAWAWYFAVAILSAFISPDKEAAFFFVFLGYYPLIKPWIEQKKLAFLLKIVYFNISVAVLYWLLISLLGMRGLEEEFAAVGKLVGIVLIILGNITFFMLDFILTRGIKRRQKHGK